MADPITTIGKNDGSNDSSISQPATVVGLSVSSGRYEIVDEIARGGMGIIFRAFDNVLRREVALKVLHERLKPASGIGRRFIEEGRITGQLQHPAIPAIHDLGTLPNGQPFLAMKLIKGQTLDAILKDRGSSAPNLIAVFEQICQAVGYAHAHDVIHRDLKPSNVMVGSFGEVQVMDWGLAKILTKQSSEPIKDDPDATSPAMTEIAWQRDDSDATRAGSVLGTPAYMSPEQAIGAIDQIDARSDVFGLGAVLCVILTQKPPYLGADSESSRQLAARGLLDEAYHRLRNSGAEPGLVNLCIRCLSPEKAGRPANAGAVADEVAALRAAADERARLAEIERVRAEADRARAEAESREQRKRRRVQLALAAVVCLFVLAAGAVALYLQSQAEHRRTEEANRNRQEQARLTRNGDEIAGLTGRCENALKDGDEPNAAELLGQIDRHLPDGGGEAMRDRIRRCRTDLVLLHDLDAVDTFRWTPNETVFRDESQLVSRWRKVLTSYEVSPGQTPEAQAAKRVSESLLKDRLLTVLELYLLYEPSNAVKSLLAVVDPDPFRNEIREAVATHHDARQAELAQKSIVLDQPAWFAAAFGRNKAIPIKRRREVLEWALRSRPGDLGLLMELATSYPINRPDGAIERTRWLQAAAATHPQSVVANSGLGTALLDQGDVDEAIAYQKRAIALAPDFATLRNNLGWSYQAKKDWDESIRCCQEAIRLQPTDALPRINIAIALREKGERAAAIKCLEEATALKPGAAPVLSHLGWTWRSLNNQDSALSCFREAIRIDPKFAYAYIGLGEVLLDKGDEPGFRKAFETAVNLEPDSATWQDTFGWSLFKNHDLTGAEKHLKAAIQLDPKQGAALNDMGLVQKARGNADAAMTFFAIATWVDPTYAKAHLNLGTALLEKNYLDAAINCFNEAIRLMPTFTDAFVGLAYAQRSKRNLDAAKKTLEHALQIDPKHAMAHNNFGVVLREMQELDQAIKHYEEAIRLNPKLALAHTNLGTALRDKNDFDGAIKHLEEAVRLQPKYPEARNNLAVALWNKGDLDRAAAEFREAIRLEPKNAMIRRNLGALLKDKGEFDAAIAAYHEAIGLEPTNSRAQNALRKLEQIQRISSRLDDVIAGRLEPMTANEACIFAELCSLPFQRRFAKSATLYEKAFAADPKLADNLADEYRFYAACAAVHVSRGDGVDAPAGAAERSSFRAKALNWLRADLLLRQRQAGSTDPAERKLAATGLTNWQYGRDLAVLRSNEPRPEMSEKERADWDAFWKDVEATKVLASKNQSAK